MELIEKYAAFSANVAIIIIIIMIPSVFSKLFIYVEPDTFQKYSIIYSILWACLLFAAVNTKGWINRFLSYNVVRYFGFISFSLYLIHPVIIGVVRHLELQTAFNAWLVIFVSILVSHASYMLIEVPCSKWRIK